MAKSLSTEDAGQPGQGTSAAAYPGGARLGGGDAPLEHPVFAAWQSLLDQLECEIPVEGQLTISALDATLHALVDDAKGDERDAKRFRALVRETRIEADEEGNIRLVALMPPLAPDLARDVRDTLWLHHARDERTIVRLVDHLRGSRP